MPEAPPSRLLRFLTHPIVGPVGAIFGLLGLVVTIYYSIQSREYASLQVYVHPLRASVVTANQSSQLNVLFHGQPIATDISAVQIALWNAGKKPIRQEDILQPLIIRTAPGHPILEAALRKQTREVVQLVLDQSKLNEGILGVGWRVLERNDGGIVQLIYSGNPSVEISSSGVFIGQDRVATQSYAGRILSGEQQMRRERVTMLLVAGGGIVLVVMILISIRAGAFLALVRDDSREGRQVMYFILAAFILGLLCSAYALYVYVNFGPPVPFDF